MAIWRAQIARIGARHRCNISSSRNGSSILSNIREHVSERPSGRLVESDMKFKQADISSLSIRAYTPVR